MRLLHTADWHLGRSLCTRPLLEDQALILAQITAIARDSRPDLVVIAGDLYDRALPPSDAVRLLDETLCELVLGLGVRVVAIAGNHDSPDRIGFAARLLEQGGLVLHGLPAPRAPVIVPDAHGTVAVHPVAYAEPASVRAALAVEVHDHDAALRAQLAALERGTGRREIVVAHGFVTGGAESPSERPLSVGTAGRVQADAFAGFAYVALGHLHRPQALAAGRLRYAGAPLAYSFAEAGQAKSVALVEIDAAGGLRHELVPLTPRRAVRVVSGTLAELLVGPRSEDYLRAELTDTGALLDPFGRLQERFPNLLEIGRPALELAGTGVAGPGGSEALERDIAELFAEFVAQLRDRPLDAAEARTFAELHAAWQEREREART